MNTPFGDLDGQDDLDNDASQAEEADQAYHEDLRQPLLGDTHDENHLDIDTGTGIRHPHGDVLAAGIEGSLFAGSDQQPLSHNYVGSPLEDAAHWEAQTTPFTCAVEAQRGVLEACTGEHFSEAELAAEAAEQGWLHTNFNDEGAGTSAVDIGKLLELHGVETHQVDNASMQNIVSELASGHKVIVGVNSSDLWHPGSINSFFSQGADHAIWVTGVDNADPDNVKVIINDSGDPEGAGKAYSLEQFKDAWEDSGNFYLATDQAPPGLEINFPDFDQHSGVFLGIVNWAQAHSLPLSMGMASLAVSGLAFSRANGSNRLTKPSRSLRDKLKDRGYDVDNGPKLTPDS